MSGSTETLLAILELKYAELQNKIYHRHLFNLRIPRQQRIKHNNVLIYDVLNWPWSGQYLGLFSEFGEAILQFNARLILTNFMFNFGPLNN